MKIQSRFWYALGGLLGCVGLNAIFHQIILQRFAFLLGLIIGIGYIWASLSLQGIRFQRKSRFSRYECGEVFEEEYEISNDSNFPKFWIEVEDASSIPSKPANRTIAQIRPRTTLYFQTLIVLANRGDFPLGPSILHSGDPFGFFHKTRHLQPDSSILVLPLVFPLEKEWQPKGDLSGGRAHREKKSPSSMSATTVRDYQPGDALNKIHWKSSVRAQKWMVKEFELEPFANIWILLDNDISSHFSNTQDMNTERLLPRDVLHYEPRRLLPRDNFEYAVSASASLIDYFIRIGRGVGLLVSGEKSISIVPEKGVRQRSILLEALAYIRPVPQLDFSSLIQTQTNRMRKGDAVIVITSLAGVEITHSLYLLQQKGVNVLLVFVDPTAFADNDMKDPLLRNMEARGIPTLVIQYGDDLGKALSEVN